MWSVLNRVAGKVWRTAKAVGDVIVDTVFQGDPNQKKEEYEQKESSMKKEIEGLDKDRENKRKAFSKRQRELDETEERLLREQRRLKEAEADLAYRQTRKNKTDEAVVNDDRNNERQVAQLRKGLSKELERYERTQQILRENQEEYDRKYAEHRERLEEDYETLKQNQYEIIQLIKALPAVEKVKDLIALTDVIMHNCATYAADPEAQLEKTKIMQNDYSIKLMEVRNVMLDGHFFPGSMKVWADGTVLDMHMLLFLATKGGISYSVVEKTNERYLGYWEKVKEVHKKHRPITEGSGQRQEIDSYIKAQFRSVDSLMSAPKSSGALQPVEGPRQLNVLFSKKALAVTGDQSGLSLPLRVSASEREGGTRRRPSVPRRELVRLRDAGPSSDDEDRLLERRVVAMSMERDGRDDSPVNYLAVAGDQSGLSLPLRLSASEREGGTRRRPSVPRRELVRLGDAGHSSDDEDRLLERRVAAMSMERDGRDDSPVNYTWERKATRSSARMSHVVPSAKGSAHSGGRTLQHGPREKQRYSRDHHGSQSDFVSSRSDRESPLSHRGPPNYRDQQDFRGSSHSSTDQRQYQAKHMSGSKQRCPERYKDDDQEHQVGYNRKRADESWSYSDEEVSRHESERRSHMYRD